MTLNVIQLKYVQTIASSFSFLYQAYLDLNNNQCTTGTPFPRPIDGIIGVRKEKVIVQKYEPHEQLFLID